MPTHVITANGTAADPNTGDVQIPIYQKKIILSDSEFKGLTDTAIEIVPDVPSGKMPLFHSGIFIKKSNNGAYTGLETTNSYFSITLKKGSDISNGNGLLFDVAYIFSNASMYSLTGASVTSFLFLPRAIYDVDDSSLQGVTMTTPLTSLSGSGLCISLFNNSVEIGGGDPANTMEVTIFYSIVDL